MIAFFLPILCRRTPGKEDCADVREIDLHRQNLQRGDVLFEQVCREQWSLATRLKELALTIPA